jgi:hypothetical protein
MAVAKFLLNCSVQSTLEAFMALSRAHVDAVLDELNRQGIPGNRRSTGYCVVVEGRHYPPKYVVGRAYWFESGREWSSDDHYGGSTTNRFLGRLLKNGAG